MLEKKYLKTFFSCVVFIYVHTQRHTVTSFMTLKRSKCSRNCKKVKKLENPYIFSSRNIHFIVNFYSTSWLKNKSNISGLNWNGWNQWRKQSFFCRKNFFYFEEIGLCRSEEDRKRDLYESGGIYFQSLNIGW